jgi:PA14 domain/Bacterial TSP3 repeat
MILSSIWFVSKSLVQRVAPVLAVVLGSSLALKAQNVIGTQWSWVNVNIDDTARSGLAGPVGGTGMTWNECIGTIGLTKTGLLNSNGVATTVGFTCNATNVGSWLNPDLKTLAGSAFNFDMNTPMNLSISGLTPGKKYTLYLASYVPNELGSRNVFTTPNVTTSGNTQSIDNGGAYGKSDRWLRGVNYTRFENIQPNTANSITLTLTSGSSSHRAHLSGFQLVENPAAATCPYAVWLAGFSFSSIPGADLALDADPDRDLYTNMEEYLLGLNPALANRRAGLFMTESWSGIAGTTVANLVASPKFYQEPDAVTYRPLSGLRFSDAFASTRSRAYLTPTVTGNYTFWLSARTSAELFLSTDLTRGKYAKQKIAAMGSDLGSGPGIGWHETDLWDRFTGQQSAVVSLQAGQTYYIEIDHHGGGQGAAHTNLAWAHDGGVREVIPDALISSYLKTSDDLDDDSLPDAWESQNALSPSDNGYSDLLRQGERGDYDGDGLTNREEYLLGTAPTNSDTDGDGQSDGVEVNTYGTSPTVVNSISTTLVTSPLLTAYNASGTSGTWQMFNGGLIGDSFRGHIEWSFTVPTDGWYLLDLSSRLRGTVRASEDLAVVMAVDGRAFPSQTMRFTNGQANSVSCLSPWLSAGNHTLRLVVNNEIGRRTLQILGLKVLAPGGFDGDSNGRPDWVDALLTSGSAVVPIPTASPVSPVFIEGSARCIGTTSVTANGSAVSVMRGLGDRHWYANTPLGTVPHLVTWSRWNAMAGQGIMLRVGDSLKIGGWLGANDLGTVQIQVQGQTHAMTAAGEVVKTFTQAGSYPVVVNHSGGGQTTATVTVVTADLGVVAYL